MVVGSWIVSKENMRCKNWINGIEITFTLSENNTLKGRISFIPKGLFKEMPTTILRAFYIYKMWRTATHIFKKIYLKKDQHPQRLSLGHVGSPDEQQPALRIEDKPLCVKLPGVLLAGPVSKHG
ncbi:hypothetical protein LQZ21_03870 [Treponema sp. TIM-1]|uniref:hypothetical protein n=1 Tax=Treponema sp. TIM-1 TaxID=2898417 RepID=UPI003980B058